MDSKMHAKEPNPSLLGNTKSNSGAYLMKAWQMESIAG